jgi:hypothetical protein
LTNVHVGPQVRNDPQQLFRADAKHPRWDLEVTAVEGGSDFRGPAVHGKRGDRFLYLTWGDVGPDGTFEMFRRAKLMFADVDPGILDAAIAADLLIGDVALSDELGGPRCARVRPPAVSWRAG